MTEADIELGAVGWLESLGFTSRTGAEIDDAGERADLTYVLLEGRLAAALHRLNPQIPHDEVEQVVRTLSRPPHPTLIQNNRWFHEQLTGGVEVSYRDPAAGEMRGGRARIIDFADLTKNEWLVVRQLQFVGPSGKTIRPDLTVFLNGMPVSLIELKNPANTQADLPAAIGQLQRYMEHAPDLFVPNVLLAASDGLLTRVGGARPVHAVAAGWGRAADAGSGDPGPVRAGAAAGLPALVCGVRGGRTRR